MSAAGMMRDENAEGSPLQLANVGGRLVYRLAGRLVAPGSVIEIRLEDCWVTGRFEWSGAEARWPTLRMNLGGSKTYPSGRKPTAAIPIPPDALLRWKL